MPRRPLARTATPRPSPRLPQQPPRPPEPPGPSGLSRLVISTLVIAVLLGSVAFATPGNAQSAATCAYLAPFGPDPAPNWNVTLTNATDGIGFRVHEDLAANAAHLAEILAAVDTWNAAVDIIDLRYQGTTTTLPETSAPSDDLNVIGPNPGSLPETELGRASVAGTTTALQFDIALNFDAAVPIGIAEPGSGTADLQSIVAHEFGHIFGLDHTDTEGQLMRSTLVAGRQVRSLGDEDRRCLEAIYGPSVEPTATPTSEPPGIPASFVSGAALPVEVLHTVSCLGGNGRVDTNIVNVGASAATYRIEFAGLSPRQTLVQAGDWWRMPITGRPDGTYETVVRRNGAVVSNQSVVVRCDVEAPIVTDDEVQVVNACRGGDGYVLFQFANRSPQPRSWVIEVIGTPNRSTSAAPWGASVRAVTGRPDGTHEVLIRSGGEIMSFAINVACD